MSDPTYKRVSWTQQFFDEDDRELVSHDFDSPPAHIAVNDYVQFSFCNSKGRVVKVSHFFRELLESDHLRHIILITLDTTHT